MIQTATQTKTTPKLRFPEFSEKWVFEKLGHLADVRDGTHESPQYVKEGYPLVTSKNLLQDGNLDLQNTDYISKEDYESINKRSGVKKGDILFGMIGTIGNPVRIKGDGFAIKNVALIKETTELLNSYLIHYLMSNPIRRQFFEENTGGTQKFIALGVIRDLKIGKPSISEQKKIAEFLTAVDEKIEKQTKKIELLKKYKKGLMQKIFSQEIRFKDENGKDFPDWEETKLSGTGKIVTGTTPSTINSSYYGDKFPWITPTDINEHKNISSSAKYLTEEGLTVGRFIPKNSLLVTCIASIGKNAILRLDGSCNQQINAIIPSNKYNVDFLYYLLEQGKNILVRFAGAGGMHILNKEDFSRLKFSMPILEEQERIADFLTAIDEKIGAEEKRLEEAKKFKKFLLQNMFI